MKHGVGRPAKFPQNEGICRDERETAEAVSDELGVSRATVERAGAYAAALDRRKSLLSPPLALYQRSVFSTDSVVVDARFAVRPGCRKCSRHLDA